MLLAVPLAVAVAVLRYRLWDLDRLVSRTVTYALVTALLVVPYLLVVPAASRLAEGVGQPGRGRRHPGRGRRCSSRCAAGSRTWSTGASTAAAMTPPAPWTAFAARLRDQVDLDALEGELLGVVDQTMQPTQASLWLRPQTGQPSLSGRARGHTRVVPRGTACLCAGGR